MCKRYRETGSSARDVWGEEGKTEDMGYVPLNTRDFSQSQKPIRNWLQGFRRISNWTFQSDHKKLFPFLWYYNVSSLEVEVLLLFYWCVERLNFCDGLFLGNLSLNRLPFTLPQHWLKKKECSKARHIVRSVYLPLSLTSFMVSGNFIFLFFVLSLWHF